ncbi:hypothetical protein IJJ54_00760 [Candidatus Saccharibacteria bacterium]|nr:hypothetical protein [Candidatus Saccharibacteria bacterium]
MTTDKRKDPRYRLLDMIMDLRLYSRTYVVNNIPNVHRDLRIRLLDESYALAGSALAAAYTVGNIRRKHLAEMCVELGKINMILSELKKVQAISPRRLSAMAGKLSDIKDVVFGWRQNEEAKKATKK